MSTIPMSGRDTPRPKTSKRPAEMTALQYSDHLAALGRRAQAVTARRTRRFHRMCREAGLDATTLHNALVGLHYGRPWENVDYGEARRAHRFQARIFDAEIIVHRDYVRTWSDVIRRRSDG